MEPTTCKCLLIGLGVVQVASSHVGPPHAHLTNCTRAQQPVLRVQDGYFDTPLCGANSARLARPNRRQRVGAHLVGGLSHGIRFQHWHLKCRLQFLQCGGRQSRRAGADETQWGGRITGIVCGSTSQQHLVDGWDSRVEGGAVRAAVLPEGGGREAAGSREDDCAARSKGCQQTCHEPMHVEKGHHQVTPVLCGEIIGGDDVGQGGSQVKLTQRHALGSSSGAAGV
mmetsp:Transcript_765/g.1917  ORF Transcript_765/g.1917 Transcript_765/m.1917 type:complete len:226 (-) Transcript_765:693-1370(-)